jgi:phospholipid/cholesterol/gamma-HCH transport system substrate-binding protein
VIRIEHEDLEPRQLPIAPWRDGFLARWSDRAYGLVFILVLALVAGLAVASYQKRFTPVVLVDLLTDRIGSQLQTSADVKIRGLVVGEVRQISTTGRGARLVLALEPDQVHNIPANVGARLLPKTLFGERFVDLVVPARPAARPIAAGAVIGQDRTRVAIELEQVFDNLLPLLRTVRPEKLAATLNALAGALEGRGQRLGANLVLADAYFKALNPKMPTLQADISGLADLASTYAAAAPDLVRMLRSLVTTNTTIVARQDALAGFLAGTAGFANTATGFLEGNGDRIIQAGRVSAPTLALLSRYAPIYPCMATGLADWVPNISQAFSHHAFHLTLEVAKPRDAYHPGEEPAWGEHRGPGCLGLPDPHQSQTNPRPGMKFNDGTSGPGSSAQSAFPGGAATALPSYLTDQSGMGIVNADSGPAGTEAEQQVVAALLSADGAPVEPSAITTLLAGPLLRGTVVSQQ